MFTYGGSSTVEPVFQAALKGFTQKGGYDASFSGIEGSGHGADAGVDVGGSSKLIGPFSVSPATNFTVASCVCTDALGIIVSAATKLPLAKINKADAVKIFKDGDGVLSAGTISTLNIYERTSDSGTWAFFNSCLGMTVQASTGLQAGVKVIPVASQSEMIAKVSADPYGIGYSSLGDVDPNAATILNLDTATGVQTYSRAAVNKGGAGWVMQRPLFAKVNNANAGATALLAYINDAGTFQKSLPYLTSYFAPKAEASYPALPLVW
jgi:ABC-type phosphate transport system substrate-binding protein